MFIVTVNSQCLDILSRHEIEETESITDLINKLDDDANLLVMQGYTAEEAISIQIDKFMTHLEFI